MAHDDPIFLGFMEAVRKNMETGGSMGIVSFLPWLRKLLPESWLGIDLMEERKVRVYSYIEVIIKSSKYRDLTFSNTINLFHRIS